MLSLPFAMERVAIPIWQGRVSPVLDTAGSLGIYEVGANSRPTGLIVELHMADIGRRAQIISEHNIQTLVCGAVSRRLHHLLLRSGIRVMPWISGDIDEVLTAYTNGGLDAERFSLPGCGRRSFRGRGGAGGGRRRGRHNRKRR